MRALIIGGSGSGKSAYAEALLQGRQHKIYLATMVPSGDEAQRRIARHQTLRADKGFTTYEQPRLVHECAGGFPLGCSVLLECLGNLTANTLFEGNAEDLCAEEEILAGIAHLERCCRDVVVVTNDIFSDGEPYDRETQRYLALLARLNAQLAARFDLVVEVVCGIGLVLKGEAP